MVTSIKPSPPSVAACPILVSEGCIGNVTTSTAVRSPTKPTTEPVGHGSGDEWVDATGNINTTFLLWFGKS